uniref:Uncharacterized protein n=1 Tax=Sinocyclocheilus grahami TaxID=75366 RepID=A0A672L1J0_SINGR
MLITCIFRTFYIYFFHEKCAVTLIEREQHCKNRLLLQCCSSDAPTPGGHALICYHASQQKILAVHLQINTVGCKCYRFRHRLEPLKRSTEKLKSKFDRNDQTLNCQIRKLRNTTDELESLHKNTTVGSLVGSPIGAVGGITSIAGLCLAPFTLGASLALTGAGAAIGAAGGVTGITENIKSEEQTLNKLEIQRGARGAADILKIAKVADVAKIGKMCAEAAKEIRVYVKAVNVIRGPAQAARAVRATAGTAKSIRMTAAATGALSALFLAVDVYCIVQDSTELSEINQPAEKRKAKDINSDTLMFIHQMRETAAAFQEILGKMKHAIDSIETCS